ncbi:MAG: hypothetical protein K2X01_08720 [Cyanobacteria bacterium]|nr:hypothetical protein [Cyanobacteriota bacterium]
MLPDERPPDLFWFLPPSFGAGVSMVLLVLLMPILLLGVQAVAAPVSEWVMSMWLPGGIQAVLVLPVMPMAQFAGVSVLAFVMGSQLLSRVKTAYVSGWASHLHRPHLLHVDYSRDPKLASQALLNWVLYRLLMVFGPTLVVLILMALVMGLSMTLFNLFIDLPTASLPIITVSGLFGTMLLGLILVLTVIYGVWSAVVTLSGDVVAMTEPDLPAKMIDERCRRIAFSSGWVFLLYPAYLVFWAGALYAGVMLVLHYQWSDVLSGKLFSPVVFGLSGALIFAYVLLQRAKLLNYHQALMSYYHELPKAFKERFTPPPARMNPFIQA